MNNLDTINSIIKNHVKHKCSPYLTTIGSINNQECGNHRVINKVINVHQA